MKSASRAWERHAGLSRLEQAAIAALAGVSCGAACQIDGGGGSGGGSFANGYAFVRDREIFVADAADYQTAFARTSSGQNSDPAMSLDGKAVAYIHRDAKGMTELRRVPTSGTATEAVVVVVQADAAATLSEPAFSRDGRRIAFVETRGTTANIVLVDLDGSNKTPVPGQFDSSPRFFPGDGDIVVLFGTSTTTRTEIDRLTLSGAVHTTIAKVSALGRRAAVSPGGQQVAFEQLVGGKTRIFVLDVAFGAASARQLTSTDGNETWPTWVSAARIGFESDAGGASNVYEIDVAVTTPGSGRLTVPLAAKPSYGG